MFGLLRDFFVDFNVKFPDRRKLYLTDYDELPRLLELPFATKYFLLESKAWNVSSRWIQRDAGLSNYLRLLLLVSSAVDSFSLEAPRCELQSVSTYNIFRFLLPRQSVRASGHDGSRRLSSHLYLTINRARFIGIR